MLKLFESNLLLFLTQYHFKVDHVKFDLVKIDYIKLDSFEILSLYA